MDHIHANELLSGLKSSDYSKCVDPHLEGPDFETLPICLRQFEYVCHFSVLHAHQIRVESAIELATYAYSHSSNGNILALSEVRNSP